MSSKNLKSKPLVEAILEVKWTLQSSVPNLQLDPHYNGLNIRNLHWTTTEVVETYLHLKSFEEDWNFAGMDGYDAL